MMKFLRHIQYVLILCIIPALCGCGEDGAPELPRDLDSEVPGVQLSLNVSVANSRIGNSTRAEDFPTETTDNIYELINTLRVIIVREDNTVECNRPVSLAAETAVKTFGDLKFKVSTSEGKIQEGTLLRTEKKRIYLIANEASIVPNPNGIDVVKYLSELQPGHYEKQESNTENSGSGNSQTAENGADSQNKSENLVYIKGDSFSPAMAESLIIYNEWPTGSNGASPDLAMPYVNNDGSDKKFVPMTEFFDIDVTENLKIGVNNKEQVENLFITRNLVKFRYSITASPGTSSFKVTAITFNSLMQEEYLFPNGTVYNPQKYQEAIDNEREIKDFNTPGFEGKNLCPYVFHPSNFGFKGNASDGTVNYTSTYEPMLYFCETKTNKLTNEGKPLFTVSIDVEYPFVEEVKDQDGNTVTQPVKAHYDAKFPLNNVPFFLPRNTIVDVNMTLSNGNLSAVATVFPYTAVNLNPEFGFTRPATDQMNVAPEMTINGMNTFGLLDANYSVSSSSTTDLEKLKIVWVASDPSIVLLRPYNNVDILEGDQRYIAPSESVELDYLIPGDTKPEQVMVLPQSTGTTYVTAYSMTGLVARCRVTVITATSE